MAPVPARLEPRLVPGTGGDCKHWHGGVLVAEHRTGIFIEANVDATCFSIRALDHYDGEIELEEDLIHFCDWPVLRDTIDQFMKDRVAEEEP